ncbi:MAG: hypothetical protein LBU88_07300 [Treponema sp.]|jgi:hypothetical protein|nr:hypothetical protein [Treponema sp.]
MGIIRYLKPGFFIYECFRITILAFTLVYILPGTSALLWMGIAAPQALFPLMALFICLDTKKHKVYLPLYIAGKSIGIISLLSWSIIFGRTKLIGGYSGAFILAELILLAGDLFTLAAALLIQSSLRKTKEAEEKQCG